MNELRATPNQLTFLRLCVIPFLALAVLDGHYRTAFALFALAGISDGLDGLLARILKQRTISAVSGPGCRQAFAQYPLPRPAP